ncbi:MAG: hypothetical protein CMF45_00915 [Legionellales bacterium]|nr:hypothetical protein [Legionellales bacterium]|tara:strand:- start:3257 stop:4501 length:1245 start_codon:yes stop_codon:yes gene_type:complete
MNDDHPIKIIDSFEGRSVDSYYWDGDTITCKIAEEPLVKIDNETHNYNLHFVIGFTNNGIDKHSIEIIIDSHPEFKHLVPNQIYSSTSLNNTFSPEDTSIDRHELGYKFKITVPSKSTIYISNTMWNPLTRINTYFNNLVNNSNIESLNYGTSVRNNPLMAYKLFQIRDTNKPLILITSGFHPAEGDSIATESIAESLASNSLFCADQYDFLIIPVVNPDGFQAGLNGCNANGINFFWDFQNHNLEGCPEAYYLWKLLKQFPPNIYIDFHSYSIQGVNKIFGPYVKPTILYTGLQTKKSASKLASSLQTIPGSKSQSMFAPSTLSYKITKEFNTITFAKYHLHQDMGQHGMRNMAVLVLQKILESIKPVELQNQILYPYGLLKKTIIAKSMQACFVKRYYGLTAIKKLISGKTE